MVSPVPPYKIPIEDVAETTPLFAWSGPLSPENKFSVPMLANVDDDVTKDEYEVEEEYPKESVDVVALTPADGWVNGSYEVNPVALVRNPESLLNQESLTDDEAMVLT